MKSAQPDHVSRLIRTLDAGLRQLLGIREFCDDPECLFRLSGGRARRRASFPDGTVLLPGEPVGILHIWAEHVPAIPPSGPDLAWGAQTIRSVRRSLEFLAHHIAENSALSQWKAFGNDTFFLFPRKSSRALLGAGFGLLEEVSDSTLLGRICARPGRQWAWLLRRAFNRRSIEGLKAQDLRRHSIWVTRRSLLKMREADRGSP